MRIRSLRIAVEMHYKFRHKVPRSWDDLQEDLAVRAEDVELLRRQFLFVGVEGHDTRYPDKPPRELLLISVYPKRLKTKAPLEEWHAIWKSSIISGDWVPAKEIQHFSGWPEVEQKIMARRAELAAAPAGVAPPVASVYTVRQAPSLGAGAPAAPEAKRTAGKNQIGAKHRALWVMAAVAAIAGALVAGILWRRTAGHH